MRKRLVDFGLPLIAVGIGSLAARLQLAGGAAPAVYLLPVALALLTALGRPTLVGSLGAWIGWTLGIAVGASIAGEGVGLLGPAIYGLLTAAAPHAVTSLLATRLRQVRARAS